MSDPVDRRVIEIGHFRKCDPSRDSKEGRMLSSIVTQRWFNIWRRRQRYLESVLRMSPLRRGVYTRHVTSRGILYAYQRVIRLAHHGSSGTHECSCSALPQEQDGLYVLSCGLCAVENVEAMFLCGIWEMFKYYVRLFQQKCVSRLRHQHDRTRASLPHSPQNQWHCMNTSTSQSGLSD